MTQEQTIIERILSMDPEESKLVLKHLIKNMEHDSDFIKLLEEAEEVLFSEEEFSQMSSFGRTSPQASVLSSMSKSLEILDKHKEKREDEKLEDLLRLNVPGVFASSGFWINGNEDTIRISNMDGEYKNNLKNFLKELREDPVYYTEKNHQLITKKLSEI